jgi:hypothetical protein
MSSEQITSAPLEQQPRHEGTLLTDGTDLGFFVGELSQREKIDRALADARQAVAQPPLEEQVQKRMEYAPLPQEIVRMMGIKIVRGLRKAHEENNINLFDDELPKTPYIYSPEPAVSVDAPVEALAATDTFQVPTKDELTARAETLAKSDVDLAA